MSADLNKEMEDLLQLMQKKETKKKYKIIIFSLFPATIGLIFLFFVNLEIKKKIKIVQNLNKSITILQKDSLKLDTFYEKAGWNSKIAKNVTTDQIISRIDDKKAFDSIPQNSSVKVEINYYVKDETDKQIIKLLNENGYKTHVLNPKTGFDTKTNCIWFGSLVSKSDIGKISQYLNNAGIKVQAIKPFLNKNIKMNIIEIGAVKKYSTLPAIPQKQVMSQIKS